MEIPLMSRVNPQRCDDHSGFFAISHSHNIWQRRGPRGCRPADARQGDRAAHRGTFRNMPVRHGGKRGRRGEPKSFYTEKLSPHAHVRDAFGLLKWKPLPSRPPVNSRMVLWT